MALFAASVSAQRAPLVVKVLDVGQGDATLIENGASRILIDGGPETSRFGFLLDSLRLNGTTFDVVILTHTHADHLVGLRSLFESRRHINVRFFYENQDPYTASNLRQLRDSISARVARNEMIYRDTDDPCANGRPICTITMRGGAKLEIMRPMPASSNPNNRSPAMKLVNADSTFSMWIAGDAEREEINWFLHSAHYDAQPGMRVDILKADHHGSCNGVSDEYLAALEPQLATVSVGDVNSYGHMHTQAKTIYRRNKVPWYRTDQNGTIVITSPGKSAAYDVAVEGGTTNMNGGSDRRANPKACSNNGARR